MHIGPVEVETRPIKPSQYLRLTRLECDIGARAFVLLGLAIMGRDAVEPKTANDVQAFSDALLDEYIDKGATFSDIMEAAGAVTLDVSRRLGFTKEEVKADADFSAATGDGSATA